MRFPVRLSGFRSDERGVAAIEAALVGALLVGALLNVVETTRYAFTATQVAAATQAGAQAAVVACDTSEVPVTTNCPEVTAAIQTALQGTSLGDDVKLDSTLDEAWYCVTADDKLSRVSGAGDKPSDCSAVGNAGAKPALYLTFRTSYPYQPLFPGLTIAAAFSDTIERTAWMRTI